MFNYGSREIIKLVIQALHQRLSERSRFLISNHVRRGKYCQNHVQLFIFFLVFLRTLAKDTVYRTFTS